jgi:hypothetical protein
VKQPERTQAMKMINRSAVVVKPAQPFLEWLHRVDSTSAHLTLEDLRLDPTIYLLPKSDNEEETLKCLRKVSGQIFKEQLNGWYRVPSVWPTERGLEELQRWFECGFHSIIIDLCDDPLEFEEV